MMRLASAGSALELEIVGYQFPDCHTAEYDSNWLRIEGRVHDPRGNWTFRDPCLLTYEAVRLAEWLESVAANCEELPYIGFIEPNLSFEVVTLDAGRVLRVVFALESRPAWALQHEDVVTEFLVKELKLAEAIGDWRKQLLRFPQRADK